MKFRQLAVWQAFLDERGNAEDASNFVERASAAPGRLVDATTWIRAADEAIAHGAAVDYQRLFALTAIACLWAQIVVSIRGKEGGFYETKRKTARFFMEQVLPESSSLYEILTRGADSLAACDIEDFGQ
jgi:hypothetical protein